MVVLRAVLYVAATLLELAGLGLVVGGVRADRRRAAELREQVAALEPRDVAERMLRTGLGGASLNAEVAMDLHRQQIALHAGDLSNAGRRQSIGVCLFAGGALIGLVANLVSL